MKKIKNYQKFLESVEPNSLKNDIIQALKDNNGELENKDLLIKTGFDISDSDDVMEFYMALSNLMREGKIKENSTKSKIILITNDVDGLKSTIQNIEDYSKIANGIKNDLANYIRTLEDNPAKQKVGHKHFYTLNTKDMDISTSLSPKYYDFLYQYKMIANKIENTEALKVLKTIH